jgi:hypothetical protein
MDRIIPLAVDAELRAGLRGAKVIVAEKLRAQLARIESEATTACTITVSRPSKILEVAVTAIRFTFDDGFEVEWRQ